MRRCLWSALLACLALPAQAEVTAVHDNGFSVSHSVTVQKDLMVIHRTMTSHVDQWWDPDHTWSGDAGNLSIDTEIGGCFCEKLPNGGEVEHLRLVHYNPGAEYRFDGALGPLQSMAVQGRMLWTIEAGETTTIRFTYHIHGHMDGGFAGLAPVVDSVISAQLNRLQERLQR